MGEFFSSINSFLESALFFDILFGSVEGVNLPFLVVWLISGGIYLTLVGNTTLGGSGKTIINQATNGAVSLSSTGDLVIADNITDLGALIGFNIFTLILSAIGFVITFLLCTVISVSGLAPTILRSSKLKRYIYGLGFISLKVR